MSLVVVGSVALDFIETPFGRVIDILGGSASYFSLSASFFTPVRLVGVVGEDFPQRYIKIFKKRNIDLLGLEIKQGGRTFRWKGRYLDDLNCAHTIYTRLNVFKDFSPVLPPAYKKSRFVFLANIDPELQYEVLSQMHNPFIVACDSMNYWIQNKLSSLRRLLRKIHILVINESEIQMLTDKKNLLMAAKTILNLGPKMIVIKRGDRGALLISRDMIFVVPAYPVQKVKDPTGAGDSFAGGFMGYLSKKKILKNADYRKAILFGTVMASFCVEGFGPTSLLRIKSFDIQKRMLEYKNFTRA